MCSNYRPATADALQHKGLPSPDFSYAQEVFPQGKAPFLANSEPDTWLEGTFGLMPHWAEPKLARHTYNARTETVAQRPSFRHAWRARQLAIIPALAFYEPCYETGPAVRWRIERIDAKAFGLAGLWETRPGAEGKTLYSFTRLTINAAEHPLMQRFHRPQDEKRSVVVVADADWRAWLTASDEEAVRGCLKPFDSKQFTAKAAPRGR